MARQVDTTYGNALFQLAFEDNRLVEINEEVSVIISAIKDNNEILHIFSHPEISLEEKLKVIDKIFANRISEKIISLIKIMVTKGHSESLVQVLENYKKRFIKEKNIGIANVTSAIELNAIQKTAIEEKIKETGSYNKVIAKYFVDETIIGGLIIRLGDKIIDSSVKTKIKNLSKNLLKV